MSTSVTNETSLSAVYVIMGVSGSGKTTVGKALAAALNCPFFDADDFHSAASIAKMARGVPLSDDDRSPWLARLAKLIDRQLNETVGLAVLACSALKRNYRSRLAVDPERVRFVYLRGDYNLIRTRLLNRDDHYMQPQLLRSQFDALQEPALDEALTLNAADDLSSLIADILSAKWPPSGQASVTPPSCKR